MIDPDFDPYEMMEELARALKWQSELIENITKTQMTASQQILELYKQLHVTNVALNEIASELDEIKQTTTGHRPRRQ